ncbi:DinB family protein [Pontibacter sp. 13R65]|uniref:DinB family protein n=1 Tax=Pontibacter sp. 13R65 TaxID=3127458 RepID=UPI00301DE33F
MKTVNKADLLQHLESSVEQHIETAIKVFQNLEEEVLLQPAGDGGWSIAQCLAHLNSYGDYYLPRLKASFANQPPTTTSTTYKSSWLGNKFIQMMDPATSRTKYKAAKRHQPPQVPDAQAVVSEFIRQQEELLLLLHQAECADLTKNAIPVSILKWLWLKPGDVLQFLVAHNQRHMLQAKRNLPLVYKSSKL